MKKFLKILGILAVVLFIVAVGFTFYIKSAFPKVSPAPDLKVEVTPERVKRGEYLANHVTVCMDCHSTRDWSKFSGPITPGTEGKGGEEFNEDMGFPVRSIQGISHLRELANGVMENYFVLLPQGSIRMVNHSSQLCHIRITERLIKKIYILLSLTCVHYRSLRTKLKNLHRIFR